MRWPRWEAVMLSIGSATTAPVRRAGSIVRSTSWMMNAPQYSSPWTQPCSQRTGPAAAPRTMATGMVTASPSGVSPTRSSPRAAPGPRDSAVPTRMIVVVVIMSCPPFSLTVRACGTSHAHDPSEPDQALDDQTESDDEQDLKRCDGRDHRGALPLHVREDLDRQGRPAGAREEQGDVDVAKGDHEREEQRREESRRHERDDYLPQSAGPRGAQRQRRQLELGID